VCWADISQLSARVSVVATIERAFDNQPMGATDDLITYVAGDLDDHDRKLLLIYLCRHVPDAVREGLRAVTDPGT